MKSKDKYLIGMRILKDFEDYTSYYLSDDERVAISKTRDVLARHYAQECISDIDFGTEETDKSYFLDEFCEESIGRIEAYNDGAERSVGTYIANANK